MAGTIKEVAQKAGVSYQAVSAVLNGRISCVSESTLKRIHAAIDEIGYRPNRMARGLVSGSTDLIGFLARDLHSPYYADLAYEVQNAADRRGLQLLMVEANWNDEKGLKRISQLMGYGVDALLLIGDFLPKIRENRLVDRKTPIIMLDTLPSSEIFWVGPDYLSGMRQAFEYLLQNGKKRITFVHDPANIPKYNAYLELSRIFGIVPSEITYCSPSVGGEESLVTLGRRIASFHPLPDALIIAADYEAALILQGLSVEGISVPDDIGIVSIDDSFVSRITSPPLSTIRIDRRAMAERAFDLLAEVRKNPDGKEKSNLIATELIIRESVMKIERRLG